MFRKVLSTASRFILALIARRDFTGYEHVPDGGCIVVSNHLGRVDALLAVALSNREDTILIVAEKYQKYAIYRWLARRLDAIFINRFEPGLSALRQLIRRLQAGEMLVMAPEGTRSDTEALIEGKHGAAYLAAKAGVPLLPLALTGTEDRIVHNRLKQFKRLDLTVHAGKTFTLPPMPRKNREEYLQESTDEIMCRIAALLPPNYRGVYADSPRVRELISMQQPMPLPEPSDSAVLGAT